MKPSKAAIEAVFTIEFEKCGYRVIKLDHIDLGDESRGPSVQGAHVEPIRGRTQTSGFEEVLAATRAHFGMFAFAIESTHATDADRLDWLDADWDRVDRLYRLGVRNDKIPIRQIVDNEMARDP